MAMEYNWSAFDLTKALDGAVVGIQNTEADYDLSKTGYVYPSGNIFVLRIQGVLLKLNSSGAIISSSDPTAIPTTTTLKIVTTAMDDEGAVGTDVTRGSGEYDEHHSASSNLTTIEPRDAFAMNVLNAMMANMKSPEALSDAAMMMYSRAAYKWAQAMMLVAADSRVGDYSGSTPQPVDVNSGDLQSNTEALLYNINQALQPLASISATPGGLISIISAMSSSVSGINTNVGNIHDDLTPVKNAYTIPNVSSAQNPINIVFTKYEGKYIRMNFGSGMAYSDLSVIVSVTIDGTPKNYGFVIPKGSVVVVQALEDAVTSIDSISSPEVRGKANNDPNTYTASLGS